MTVGDVVGQMFEAVQGAVIMLPSFSIGIELDRGLRFAGRIGEGLFPGFPLEEMIGQESPVLINPLGKNRFHGFPDPLMQQLARRPQKRLISDLLRQGVVKDIFNFRDARPLPDQGRVFEQRHLGVQVGFFPGHTFEHPEQKDAADDRRLLDHPFGFFG